MLMFSVLILAALGRLNQMQQVGNCNVQTEATWFMKIGEHVIPVKCFSFNELSKLSYINKSYNNGRDASPSQDFTPPLI